MFLKHNALLAISMFIFVQAAHGMHNRDVDRGIGFIDEEAEIELSTRNISVNHAMITNHEDKSQHFVNVNQHVEPNTIVGSIKKGMYNGIEGVATQLTVNAIMFPLSKGWELLTQESPNAQLKLNNKAINDFNRIHARLGQLKALQEEAKDKEVIAGYNVLIKQCEDEIALMLKNHLAQALEQAKVQKEIAG